MYPFILSRDVSEEELQFKINCCDIKSNYMIGRRYEGEIQQQTNMYHLSKQQLETLLYSLACINLTTQDLHSKLEKYRVKNMLVLH